MLSEEMTRIKKTDKSIELYDNEGIIDSIDPIAIENCMRPGEFIIYPVELECDGKRIIFKTRDKTIEVVRSDIDEGRIHVVFKEFTPTIVRKKNSCIPCTNCGRCSW